MTDKECINAVLYNYHVELKTTDYKIHENILPYVIVDNLIGFEKKLVDYEVSTYTKNYSFRITIRNLESKEMIFDETFKPSYFRKYDRKEKIDDLLDE